MKYFIAGRERKIYFTKDNTAFYKSKGNQDVTYMFKKTKKGLELRKKYLKRVIRGGMGGANLTVGEISYKIKQISDKIEKFSDKIKSELKYSELLLLRSDVFKINKELESFYQALEQFNRVSAGYKSMKSDIANLLKLFPEDFKDYKAKPDIIMEVKKAIDTLKAAAEKAEAENELGNFEDTDYSAVDTLLDFFKTEISGKDKSNAETYLGYLLKTPDHMNRKKKLQSWQDSEWRIARSIGQNTFFTNFLEEEKSYRKIIKDHEIYAALKKLHIENFKEIFQEYKDKYGDIDLDDDKRESLATLHTNAKKLESDIEEKITEWKKRILLQLFSNTTNVSDTIQLLHSENEGLSLNDSQLQKIKDIINLAKAIITCTILKQLNEDPYIRDMYNNKILKLDEWKLPTEQSKSVQTIIFEYIIILVDLLTAKISDTSDEQLEQFKGKFEQLEQFKGKFYELFLFLSDHLKSEEQQELLISSYKEFLENVEKNTLQTEIEKYSREDLSDNEKEQLKKNKTALETYINRNRILQITPKDLLPLDNGQKVRFEQNSIDLKNLVEVLSSQVLSSQKEKIKKLILDTLKKKGTTDFDKYVEHAFEPLYKLFDDKEKIKEYIAEIEVKIEAEIGSKVSFEKYSSILQDIGLVQREAQTGGRSKFNKNKRMLKSNNKKDKLKVHGGFQRRVTGGTPSQWIHQKHPYTEVSEQYERGDDEMRSNKFHEETKNKIIQNTRDNYITIANKKDTKAILFIFYILSIINFIHWYLKLKNDITFEFLRESNQQALLQQTDQVSVEEKAEEEAAEEAEEVAAVLEQSDNATVEGGYKKPNKNTTKKADKKTDKKTGKKTKK
jgi:hypothetical protein